MIRQRNLIGCRCCDDRPRIPCAACFYVGWNSCCTYRTQFYRVRGRNAAGGAGFGDPFTTDALCPRLWPKVGTNVPSDPGLADPFGIYFLKPIDENHWQRLHTFGDIMVTMTLDDYHANSGGACSGPNQRLVTEFKVEHLPTGDKYWYQCRNGRAYVNRTDICTHAGEQRNCLPFGVDHGSYSLVKPYPTDCDSMKVTCNWHGFANTATSIRCDCLNRSAILDHNGSSARRDGNCVGGNFRKVAALTPGTHCSPGDGAADAIFVADFGFKESFPLPYTGFNGMGFDLTATNGLWGASANDPTCNELIDPFGGSFTLPATGGGGGTPDTCDGGFVTVSY